MLNIQADYIAIEMVREICEPWIRLWSGDEWGEVMDGLLMGSQVDYGISDEDCASVASILLKNVNKMWEWYEKDNGKWCLDVSDEEMSETRAEALKAKEYWLKGGNLGESRNAKQIALETSKLFGDWMFENEN